MTFKDLANKKILIVGYGREGKTTEEFLQTMVPSAAIGIADSSQGEKYLDTQNQYDIAIKSPGVRPDLVTIPYTTATNIFFELVKGVTVGVTGTKGKSTTASLIFAILQKAGRKAHLVGNIGTPMLSELLKSNTKDDIWVCELSSYQLLDIAYSPHISVITSLFPEHMNYHGSVKEYYKAKARIVAFAIEKDYVVCDPKNPAVTVLLEKAKAIQIPFAKLPFPDLEIPLLGKHNRDNVRGAVAVGQLLNIQDSVIENAIKQFHPLRHRLQFIGEYKGIKFFDDAISTTPQSTLAALDAIYNVGTLFLGGEDRGYDFSPLITKLVKLRIPNLVFFPTSGETMKKLLSQQKAYFPKTLTTSFMKEAVAFAYENSSEGSVCLLSCASPSYTLWKNFEVKGDEFQKYVRELGK